jgi:hypothetical protein
MLRQPLPIQFPPGTVVRYDKTAQLPPEATALMRLRARRTRYRGQVTSSTEGSVEVIWENGRRAIYGYVPWYGRLACLQVLSRPSA